jgi:hypothetical protein
MVEMFRSKIRNCRDEEEAEARKRHEVLAVGCVRLIQIIDPAKSIKGKKDNLKG